MKDKAEKHIKELVTWLHGIVLGMVPDMSYNVDPDDGELTNYTKERQSCCILPSLRAAAELLNPGDNTSISRQLNKTLTAHAEAARESNAIRR